MLVPRNINEHPEALLGRTVQEPPGRRVVNPQQVASQVPDLLEIANRLLDTGKRLSGGIRREGTISHAFDVELVVAQAKEFAVRADAQTGRSRDCHAL